jgi:hypothetical protein
MQLGSAVSAPLSDIWVALVGGNCDRLAFYVEARRILIPGSVRAGYQTYCASVPTGGSAALARLQQGEPAARRGTKRSVIQR